MRLQTELSGELGRDTGRLKRRHLGRPSFPQSFIPVSKIIFLREEWGGRPQQSPGHRCLKMQNPGSFPDLLGQISEEGVQESTF